MRVVLLHCVRGPGYFVDVCDVLRQILGKLNWSLVCRSHFDIMGKSGIQDTSRQEFLSASSAVECRKIMPYFILPNTKLLFALANTHPE
jgi:hypothetical protein